MKRILLLLCCSLYLTSASPNIIDKVTEKINKTESITIHNISDLFCMTLQKNMLNLNLKSQVQIKTNEITSSLNKLIRTIREKISHNEEPWNEALDLALDFYEQTSPQLLARSYDSIKAEFQSLLSDFLASEQAFASAQQWIALAVKIIIRLNNIRLLTQTTTKQQAHQAKIDALAAKVFKRHRQLTSSKLRPGTQFVNPYYTELVQAGADTSTLGSFDRGSNFTLKELTTPDEHGHTILYYIAEAPRKQKIATQRMIRVFNDLKEEVFKTALTAIANNKTGDTCLHVYAKQAQKAAGSNAAESNEVVDTILWEFQPVASFIEEEVCRSLRNNEGKSPLDIFPGIYEPRELNKDMLQNLSD